MTHVLKNEHSYVRLLDGSGNALTSSSGALSVGASFSGDVTSSAHDSFNVNANMQISNADLSFGQGLMAASLPVCIASNQSAVAVSATDLDIRNLTNVDVVSAEVTVMPVVGTHANASNAQTTVGTNEDSTSVDCRYASKLSAFGVVDQACTISLFCSQDNSNWYDTGVDAVLSGAGDFYISLSDAGARYYKLRYSAASTTVTATIAAKN